MSVLIRGMEMPEMCDMCPFLAFIEKGEDHDAFCYCKLRNWKKSCTPEPITVFQARRFRHLECPLVEVPPHGDLIDRNALVRELYSILVSFGSANGLVEGGLNIAISTVNGMPTIIPAELPKEV